MPLGKINLKTPPHVGVTVTKIAFVSTTTSVLLHIYGRVNLCEKLGGGNFLLLREHDICNLAVLF